MYKAVNIGRGVDYFDTYEEAARFLVEELAKHALPGKKIIWRVLPSILSNHDFASNKTLFKPRARFMVEQDEGEINV